MKDYNSDQAVLATKDAERANDPTCDHESYGGPVSLAEHFRFPDAIRMLRKFDLKIFNAGFRTDEYGCLELRFSEEDKSALDEAKKLSDALVDLVDWLNAKVYTYQMGGEYYGAGPYYGGTPTKKIEEVGEIEAYCGNECLWGYVFRNEKTWHVRYEDFWDTIVLPDSVNSVESNDDYPEEVKKLLVDLYVHAAKQGFVAPE